MNLAGYQDVLAKDADTALKVNISWHFFFPGSSTTPWQLDGVITAMKRDGYDPSLIHACHNRTVVIDAHLGETENKQLPVVQAHGIRNIHLYEGDEPWIHIRDAVGDLADQFICLNDVYPDGFMIPRRFIGENILHLPDGEDARLHHHHRRDEERLRRAAERAPALDPPGDSRDARRPADDPEEDSPRRVRGDGRHLCRRRPGAALHGAARQERDARQRRPGGHRRRRGEADGHGSDVDQVHPHGPRARAGLRRSARHRDGRRPRGRERELAVHRAVQGDDLRGAHAAQDLLGGDAQADRVVAQDGAGAVGVHRQRDLPRQFLVSDARRTQHPAGARQPVGTAVRELGAADSR